MTADKVFITNGDDFHSPAEEATSPVCAVFGLVVNGLSAFPCFFSRYGRGKRRGPQISPLMGSSLFLGTAASANEPFKLYCPI